MSIGFQPVGIEVSGGDRSQYQPPARVLIEVDRAGESAQDGELGRSPVQTGRIRRWRVVGVNDQGNKIKSGVAGRDRPPSPLPCASPGNLTSRREYRQTITAR
jgi:hypothetical protein